MVKEKGTNQETADISEIHLGDPSWRPFPSLRNHKSIALKLRALLDQRRINGFVLSEDAHARRRLGSIEYLISKSASGLNVPERSFSGLTIELIRQAKDFKDILGLDDVPAKQWADRATEVLQEAGQERDLSAETIGFLDSDIEPFVERLSEQPIFIGRFGGQ